MFSTIKKDVYSFIEKPSPFNDQCKRIVHSGDLSLSSFLRECAGVRWVLVLDFCQTFSDFADLEL